MSAIFNIVSIPFGYVMRFIYDVVGNYGLTIILFTLLTKLLLLPLTLKQKKSMMAMQSLQPKLQAVQKKWGADRQKYAEETQKIYDNAGVSPMAGCGTTLLSFPIMIGLYYVIVRPLTYLMHLTAEQITAIGTAVGSTASVNIGSELTLAGLINQNFSAAAAVSEKVVQMDFSFLGMNLTAQPSIKSFGLLWLIPVLSGLSAMLMSYIQQRQQKKTMGDSGAQAQQMNTMMLFMMPLMSVYFGFILPAGVGIYWICNNLFSGLQEWILNKYYEKHPPKLDV